MQKLIELLNEYEKKSEVHWYEWYGQDVLMCRYIIVKDGFEFYTDEAATIAISKYYGFIKWLVENDKIDRDKELKENGLFRKYFYDLEYVKNYDRLVMWLSVEDEPINFLISILK